MRFKEDENMKKLPCGNSNFKDIMLNNYVYIDKTRYIEMMENESIQCKFIVRPPGFGKSLFVSTLESYYDIKQKDDFNRLFGGLYIGQHPTPKRNSYAILKFNFRDVDSFDSGNFIESFSQNIRKTVFNFLENYRDYIPKYEQKIQWIENYSNGPIAMDWAIDIIANNDNQLRIYLLIDDYDYFARHLVATGKCTKEVETKKFMAYMTVRNFYLRLEIAALINSKIHHAFITGVSYASWSTASNLMIDDISEDRRYNEIMGFTEEELQSMPSEIISRISFDYDKKMANLLYGGYVFDEDMEDTDNKIYTPKALIDFIQYKMEHFDEPELLNENLLADYTQLQSLLQNEKTCKTILDLSKNNITSRRHKHTYQMEDLADENQLTSLLLNLGLVTYHKQKDKISWRTVKPPNYLARCILNYFVYAKRHNEHPEKIIFLDIDGVLQPTNGAQERFEHLKEVDEFNSRLLEEYGVDYSGYNYYDVLAVYYDWDKDAVAELKRILEATGAKIVLSSDWRNKTIFRMVDLCRIHDLDDYIIGATMKEDISPILDANPQYKKMRSLRSIEILMYLADHPEIKNYVAIDDKNLTPDLGEQHTVITYNKMTAKDADKCIKLLNVKHKKNKKT
jgi:hypothetical protein